MDVKTNETLSFVCNYISILWKAARINLDSCDRIYENLAILFNFMCVQTVRVQGRELNSAATLASQPAIGHSLSFITTIVIMTLGLRPVCGAGRRKLQPNLAPMPYDNLHKFCSFVLGNLCKMERYTLHKERWNKINKWILGFMQKFVSCLKSILWHHMLFGLILPQFFTQNM